ncbi:hypothetical protein [uncultured Psychrobacter sp.]|uniref:hypothetical protein n=1 Tax=uncultured Psychrobacter sp. TaxID=259303 RepID=UPI0030D97221
MRDFLIKEAGSLDPQNQAVLLKTIQSADAKTIELLYHHLQSLTKIRRKSVLSKIASRYEAAASYNRHRYPNTQHSVKMIGYYPKIEGIIFECLAHDPDDIDNPWDFLVLFKQSSPLETLSCGDHEAISLWNKTSLQAVRESDRNINAQTAIDKNLLKIVEVGDIFGDMTVTNGTTPISSTPKGFFQVTKIKGPNIYIRGIKHQFIGEGLNIQPIPDQYIETISIPYWLRVGTFKHLVDGDKKFLRCNLKGERRQAYLYRKNKEGRYELFFKRAY